MPPHIWMVLQSLLSTLYSCFMWHWMEQAGIQVKVQHSVNNSESTVPWVMTVKEEVMPLLLKSQTRLQRFRAARYKTRCNLMSIWASVPKMLALLCLWFTVYLGQWQGREGDPGCDWEVSSLGQDVHMNLKLLKRVFQSCLPKSGVF